MSADITISVQVLDRRHGWIDLPDVFALGTASQRCACDPETRDYRVMAVLGRPWQNHHKIVEAPFAHRGSPPDLYTDHPHHGQLGATWATVAELRTYDWSQPTVSGGASDFERWLRHGVLDVVAAAYGADNVRVLVGFDS